MAGSLWGDPKAVFTRELDDLDDVLDGLDQCDRERPLINREVPRPTSIVPLGVAWKHESAGEPAPQGVEIARPDAIGEIRGTSTVGHQRHATSSTFSALTARRCAALHASSRYYCTRLGWSRRSKLATHTAGVSALV